MTYSPSAVVTEQATERMACGSPVTICSQPQLSSSAPRLQQDRRLQGTVPVLAAWSLVSEAGCQVAASTLPCPLCQ